MLFGDFLPSVDEPDRARIALLDAILLDFRKAFPELNFELRLDRRVVNAQAILLDEMRCVLIYGGLALHPNLAENSLTFVFLHEVGHHLALGPRLRFNPTLACDCVADSWAAQEGLGILHRKSGRRLKLREALDELVSLSSSGDRDLIDQMQRRRKHLWSLQNDWSDVQQSRSICRCDLIEPK